MKGTETMKQNMDMITSQRSLDSNAKNEIHNEAKASPKTSTPRRNQRTALPFDRCPSAVDDNSASFAEQFMFSEQPIFLNTARGRISAFAVRRRHLRRLFACSLDRAFSPDHLNRYRQLVEALRRNV